MGFIAKLKRLFKKRIDSSDISEQQLITLASDKTLKFGKQLDVTEGFVAVMVANGKVADAFVEGSYRLEVGAMPILSRILKLQKPNKKGELPTKFRTDIYFINLKNFEDQLFCSNMGVLIKDKAYKRFAVMLKGKFSYQIINPVDFLEAMLTQYGVIRDGVAKDEIALWVGDLSDRKIQKNKPSAELLYERESSCFDGLIDFVNKELFDCGVKINSIEVTETKFPKKVFKNTKFNFSEVVQQNDASELNACGNANTNADNIAIDQSKENVLNYNDKPNIATQTDSQLLNTHTNENQRDYYDDVDTTPISKTIEYVKCLNCGAYNSKLSEHCFSCKIKLK